MAYGLKGFPGVGVKEPNNNGHNNRMSKVILSQNTSKPDERRNKEIESIEGRKEERGNKEPKKEKNKQNKLARLGMKIKILAATALSILGIGKATQLYMGTQELKALTDEATQCEEINFEFLSKKNMSNELIAAVEEIDGKYSDFNDPSTQKNESFGQDLYTVYKVAQGGKKLAEIPNFNCNNLKIEVNSYFEDELYYMEPDGEKTLIKKIDEPVALNVTAEYLAMKKDPNKGAGDFADYLCVYLAKEYGVKEKQESVKSNGDVTRDGYVEGNKREEFIKNINQSSNQYNIQESKSGDEQEEPENQNYSRQADTMNNEISTGDGR